MIPSRTCSSPFLLGILVAGTVAVPGAWSGEADGGGQGVRISSQCGLYGPGFVDLGNGTCGQVTSRVGGHVRIEPVARSGNWPNGGTSNAALRSDGLGMLPGANDARHLRVQSGVDPYEH